MSKYIPVLLDERYNQMQELRTAEDLQISLENSCIATDMEKEIVARRIRQLQTALEESAPAAEAIINSFSENVQAWSFMRLRFLSGYSWVEISVSLKIPEETIKAAVYRAFHKAKTNTATKEP